MAPLRIQPVDPSRETLTIESLEALHSVADLKASIASQTGIEASAQRLVARGRVLQDEERLEALGLAAGGRIFLAVASQVGQASAEGAPVGDGTVAGAVEAEVAGESPGSDEAGGQADGAGGAGFEVFARLLDSEEDEVRVFVRPAAPAVEFKREVLRRLRQPAAEDETEVERWSFVCGGRLLGAEAPGESPGFCAGARVVVVPPRVLTSPARRGGLAACGRRLRGGLEAMKRSPWSILEWLCQTWYDPWSLVRPRPRDGEEEPRGRRIQTLTLHRRTLRYAPGQNPHGEDLTMLLAQGLVGGA